MTTMFISLGPTMAARKIAHVSPGIASQASVTRMMTWSTQPPRYPDRIPSVVPSTPAKITAVKPTTIDTRAPKISRDSTSRPTWSVPSRCVMLPPCCHAGGRKRSPSSPTCGSCGAMKSAKIASTANTSRMLIGNSGRPSRRNDARRPGNVRTAARLTLIANPRIDHGVREVHREVDDHDHEPTEDDRRLHHGEVAERNALVEQPPDARPREDSLDYDGDIDHEDEIDPGQRQHRDQRVLEGVLADDERLRQPLEPRELDVLGAEHLEHRRTCQAHVGGGEIPPQREGRHQHVPRRARARRRQPAEIHREEEDEQQADPEGRHRKPEQS